jgi:hypothetical protein
MNAKSVSMSFGNAKGKSARLWNDADRGFTRVKSPSRSCTQVRISPFGPSDGFPTQSRNVRCPLVIDRTIQVVKFFNCTTNEGESDLDLLYSNSLARERVSVSRNLNQTVTERTVRRIGADKSGVLQDARPASNWSQRAMVQHRPRRKKARTAKSVEKRWSVH